MSPLILGIMASSQPGANNSYESIASFTVGSTPANITFSSIPATYKHLQIRGIMRSSAGGGTDFLQIIANGDTGTNYAYHSVRGNGSAASAGGAGSTVFYGSIDYPASGAAANTFGALTLDLLDYTNTNKFKTFRILAGADTNGSGMISFISGLWRNTNAVTSISINAASASFSQYSSFALYGIKG